MKLVRAGFVWCRAGQHRSSVSENRLCLDMFNYSTPSPHLTTTESVFVCVRVLKRGKGSVYVTKKRKFVYVNIDLVRWNWCQASWD